MPRTNDALLSLMLYGFPAALVAMGYTVATLLRRFDRRGDQRPGRKR